MMKEIAVSISGFNPEKEGFIQSLHGLSESAFCFIIIIDRWSFFDSKTCRIISHHSPSSSIPVHILSCLVQTILIYIYDFYRKK